ncbi:hypothetical protein QVD17_32883 [Tagetes erecta]|uniref:Uncharacterized protein n=1 Tax=Tagetes erecta TaxID=13708 RepID=A0AAD8JWT9_TARER|nr:hypothetical protein QVD17_32883 [Tagetes erecta]
MASSGSLRFAVISLIVLVISATTTFARDFTELSPAPAPAPLQAGSAVPVTLSTAIVAASMLISVAGFMLH